ncbi:cupin domain protein, PF06172 family protein (macronuclear) [Tetrahymena thermophila SB210]|uniref:Cupin domain protein, PF06172 family protein n=1 Tax=Tetrahymena thermophila (strain SB210) TaxID=312017 RepID=I7M893_TETTS|nr:cupin domain protein, PF06172 family protein [Tetrahymena thermophila SB210]EAR97410.1 cupin domain protein, PF06172 family protein [Tetrahymena thermophila SB210]|eukprot:XP_001017655.1 cupin domain protein, PF06172 family protein [Tetrahymena thermophila SB210]
MSVQQGIISPVNATAQYFVQNLNLFKLPNKMYLAELYTSQDIVKSSDDKERKATSAVYCLYESGVFVGFHTMQADEILVLNYGCSLEIIIINEDGSLTKEVLGYDLEKGEKPQLTVAKNTLFTVVNSHQNPNAFSLVTAFNIPAYDESYVTFPKKQELIEKYPQHKELIEKYAEQ